MTLSSEQLAAYAAVFDFRSQFVPATIRLLAAAGITAYGPGQGREKVGRSVTTVDFARGAATGSTSPIPLDPGGGVGPWRLSVYHEYEGTLSIANTVGFETEEKTGEPYLTQEHIRTLDQLCAQQMAIFMEGLQPFDSDTLPNLDVLQILPIEPDERPEEQREVNLAFVRFRVRFCIRRSAWPVV